MGIIEIVVIGVGLSMDAVCVCLSNGICMSNLRRKHIIANAFMFGFFQGLMPILGFYAGSLFIDSLSDYTDILVAVIFFFLGGKMLFDAFFSKDESEKKVLTPKLLLVQGIATSIDALAVGVSFSALKVDIYFSASLIAALTFTLSLIALLIGKKVGCWLGKYAEIAGGILLISIGVNSLIS